MVETANQRRGSDLNRELSGGVVDCGRDENLESVFWPVDFVLFRSKLNKNSLLMDSPSCGTHQESGDLKCVSIGMMERLAGWCGVRSDFFDSDVNPDGMSLQDTVMSD